MRDNIQEQISPEIFGKLVKNQAEELNLRKEEIVLRKQEDKHAYDFSMKALSAQVEDRKHIREYQKRIKRDRYFFWAFLSAIIATIIIFALILREKEVALKIIEVVIYFSTGGVGGYALGKNQRNNPPQRGNTEE